MPYHILVVDDEPDVEALFTQKFRSKIREGEYIFYFAVNGFDALEKLDQIPEIDVVFTDINMPEMDGITLLSKIRERGFICKTNVVSAYGDLKNIRNAMNNGAYDFVIKPIELDDLDATLKKSLLENKLTKEGLKAKADLLNAIKEREQAQQLALERLLENERIILEQNEMLEQKVSERTRELEIEKRKSDELLLSILPRETAEELKLNGKVAPKFFNEVTVLFADFVNFTALSANLSPEELIHEINHCFCAFDEITEKHGVEKIKTIGDAYMCAEGVPIQDDYRIDNMIHAATEMISFVHRNKAQKREKGLPAFDVRIGIHTGPIMAGVVGLKKFNYDIWGDTVNFAARMESHSEPGKINISQETYEKIADRFETEFRGSFEVKGKGSVNMYYLKFNP